MALQRWLLLALCASPVAVAAPEKKKPDKVIPMEVDSPAPALLFTNQCAEFILNVSTFSPKRLTVEFSHKKGSKIDGYFVSDFRLTECPTSVVDTGVVVGEMEEQIQTINNQTFCITPPQQYHIYVQGPQAGTASFQMKASLSSCCRCKVCDEDEKICPKDSSAHTTASWLVMAAGLLLGLVNPLHH